MLNNAAVDIAIGLMLMYLVLSMVGTIINEYISTVLNLRTSTLQSAIKSIVDNQNLRDEFYNHGVIDSITQALGKHPSYLSGQSFAAAIVGSVAGAKAVPSFEDVQQATQQLPDCNIRDVLLAQLTKAHGDLDTLHKNISDYFDSAMDRVSGIYKRYLKWITLIVGAIMVIALNADSIKIGSTLWSDSSLRAQMVASAGDFLKNKPRPAASAASSTATVTGDSTAEFAKELDSLETTVRPLPIGWKAGDFITPLSWAGAWSWLLKILGLAITALAISLGAPFWFDMLSKFMNIRGVGDKPKGATSS